MNSSSWSSPNGIVVGIDVAQATLDIASTSHAPVEHLA